MTDPTTSEALKTAKLKAKIASMSFEARAQRAFEIAISGHYEENRDEFVKLLFGPDAVEVDD